ncbi:MAG TPA: response regulator transcription factor [Candidatus Dormibacteraeota bacterium]|nr:response regulator transcription factor [Candidatus Dormibacteraeota bacterium]
MIIRVALADDQQLVRTGFRMIVQSQPDMEVVGEAEDGRQAIEVVTRHKPDVVLMDIRMPHLDGIAATKQVSGQTKVIILTTFELDEYVFDALAAGASGFLLKAAPPEDLVKAIRVVAQGEALLAPSVTKKLIEEFTRHPERTPNKSKELESLTDREREVLKEVAKGLTNAEIAAQLHVSETTIKTHVAHLLDKLELRDRVQAVIVAYESGLAG